MVINALQLWIVSEERGARDVYLSRRNNTGHFGISDKRDSGIVGSIASSSSSYMGLLSDCPVVTGSLNVGKATFVVIFTDAIVVILIGIGGTSMVILSSW